MNNDILVCDLGGNINLGIQGPSNDYELKGLKKEEER